MNEQTKQKRRICHLYERTVGRAVPRGCFLPILLIFAANCSVYFLTDLLLGENVVRHSLAIPLDGVIPLVPVFILPYFASYFLWVATPFFLAKRDRAVFFDMATSFFLSILIAFLFFYFYPVAIERPAVEGNDIFSALVRILYAADAPHNLFPSLHCMHTWTCYLAIRGKREYSPLLRWGVFVFAFFVFASTVLLRQHYLLDIVGGVFFAELCFFLVKRTKLSRILEKGFISLSDRVFLK